jgi:hypothetical protein
MIKMDVINMMFTMVSRMMLLLGVISLGSAIDYMMRAAKY